jgi:hypothetical protein
MFVSARYILTAAVTVHLAYAGAAPALARDPITIHDYFDLQRGKDPADSERLRLYMDGVAHALHASNIVLGALKKPRLYCANMERPLGTDEIMAVTNKVLADQIKRGNTPPGEMGIATVAANAVSVTYRCR